MHCLWAPFALLGAGVVAAPTPGRLPAPDRTLNARAAAPTVKIANGTVKGFSDGYIESFKGIPYAQPPVGSLRLAKPRPITASFGTIDATGVPTQCPQFFTQINSTGLASDVIQIIEKTPLGQALEGGEDCLNLNVQRPAGTSANDKLPVVVWIFGGGFELGGTALYDGSLLLNRAEYLGKPILYVAMNYRVAAWGFLGGKELQSEGNTNLGLRDQRLALQWVQDNIAAFGGDPSQVTIWGESAGAISVFDHTIVNGGDNTYKGKPLFRRAIMDSGSLVPARDVSSAPAQAIFDAVTQKAGCSSRSDKLACLRSLSPTDFLNAANSVPGIFSYRSLDLSFLPRPDPNDAFFTVSPEVAVQNGRFAKVPVIIGDQADEGTLFALTQGAIATTKQLTDYLASYFDPASASVVAGLVATYPDDPSQGSPFGTGSLYQLYPQYKRLAAILGDITFTLTRRVYLRLVASSVDSYSYLSTYYSWLPVLGTFHATDIPTAFYDIPDVPEGLDIQTYYIGFITTGDPNALGHQLAWPKWSVGQQLMNFSNKSNSLTKDDFRQASADYLGKYTSQLRI